MAADPKGTMSYRTKGEFPSIRGGQGLSKGRRGMEGVAGGLKQEGWDMGRLFKGLGSWGGLSLEGWDGHLFGRSSLG